MVLPNNENTDVETKIRTDRIIKVLNETILKIELAICLPDFLRDINNYKSHFDDDEYLVLTKCKEYQCLEECHSDENSDELESDKGDEVKLLSPQKSIIEDTIFAVSEGAKDFEMIYDGPTKDPAEDPNIKRAMYIIWQHPDLVHIIKSKYLKFSNERPSFIFLENIYALKMCLQTRLMEDLSPDAEKKKVQFYKEIWKKNDEALVEIQTLKPKLDTIKSRVEKELEENDNLISEMLARMKTYESNFKEEIEKICTESEKTMIFESKNSEIRQEVIRNDIESLEKTFQNTLDSDLKREKDLRTKRYKVESQLEACLEKYDNDLGERQAEFEELNAEFDEEKRQMNLLQEKFDEQEKEYVILMEEKALEEYLELERRIEDLRRRVAARIIQTHWRGLKQRRLERAKSKKARKGKGKKKSPKRPGSAGKRPGSAGKRPGSAGKRPGSAGKKPGSPRKPGSAGKRPGSAGKKPGSAVKRPGSAGKEPGSAGKKPGSAGKKAGSPKKPGSARKRPGSAGKRPGSAGKKPGSPKKPGSAGKKPGSAGKKPGSAGKKPGSAGKKPGSARKKPGSPKKPGSAGKKK